MNDLFRHEDWRTVVTSFPKPWPRAAARHDLRWHAAEYGAGLPLANHSRLAARWGWSRSAVYRLATGDTWVIGDVQNPWLPTKQNLVDLDLRRQLAAVRQQREEAP